MPKTLLIALETTLPCDFILGTAERAASSNTSAARSTEGERGQISAATTPALQSSAPQTAGLWEIEKHDVT